MDKNTEMKILNKVKELQHRVDMMKKRQEQIIHDAMTLRSGRSTEMKDELVLLETKMKEDEKFISFLKDLLK